MTVVRTEVRDAYSRDGETVVMLLDNTVLLLSPLASFIWEASESAVTEDELVALIVAEFGAPPEGDASDLVRASVEALVTVAVLTLV